MLRGFSTMKTFSDWLIEQEYDSMAIKTAKDTAVKQLADIQKKTPDPQSDIVFKNLSQKVIKDPTAKGAADSLAVARELKKQQDAASKPQTGQTNLMMKKN